MLCFKLCDTDSIRRDDHTHDEYTYFTQNRDAFIRDYCGKHVVIKNKALIGVYDGFYEAYSKTLLTEELGTFVIQQCVTLEEEENSVRFAERTTPLCEAGKF